MQNKVELVEYSENPATGTRLATLVLTYPRFIHAEFMTHRTFSRNASSSRAIPIMKMLKQVWYNPAMPIHWGANNPGMQSKRELTGVKLWFAKKSWTLSAKLMCGIVWAANKVAAPHKQIFNRLLEPWQMITVVVTATEWDNFFELRDHEDAQPEIRDLARKIKLTLGDATPIVRDYHLPFVKYFEIVQYDTEKLLKISTARCARVSYLTHDGRHPDARKDVELHDRLVGSRPIHASPTEHQARSAITPGMYKNLRDWVPYRTTVESQQKAKRG